jgi:ABC-2 type transport system ATP-binding protein
MKNTVSGPWQAGVGAVSGPPGTAGAMTNSAIVASGMRKSFKDKVVLDSIDLDVPAGSVFSLLGPNGAGKTTTVHLLTTLLTMDSGTARVAGYDVATETRKVRSAIGVTGQFASVDELLSGRENLRLMADLHRLEGDEGRNVVEHLLRRFDLEEYADERASAYSGGMRRKLDLAMTLVGRPRIIFLDEPTTGLDPRSRRTMWTIVRELVADGMTIFLTTQYLEEADQLADRIAVLDQGRLVAQGTPEQLKRRVPGGHVRLRFADVAQLGAALRVLPGATPDEQGLALRVPGDGGARSLRTLLDRLDEHAVDVEEFTVHTPDLDDVFLALTGHPSTPAGSTTEVTTP